MSQFRVLVGVKLDTKSLSTLKQQINNTKNIKLQVGATLDSKSLSALRQRISQTKDMRVSVDAKLDPKSLSVLKQRLNQAKGLRVKVGVRLDTKGLTALRNQIGKIKTKAIKLDIDTKGSKGKVDTVIKQINKLKSGKVKLNLDTTSAKQKITAIRNQIKSLGNVKVNLKLNVQNGQINQAKQSIQGLKNTAMNGVHFKFNTGTFANEVNKIRNAFNTLPAASNKATASVKNLRSAYSSLTGAMKSYNPNDAGSVQRAINAYNNYTIALKRTKNQLDVIKRSAVDPFAKMKLSNQIDEWLAKNTRATRAFKNEVDRLKAALKSCNNATDFKRINQQFNNLKTAAVSAGKAGMTFGERLKAQFGKYAAYMGISSAFMMATQSIRYMFNAVKDVDKAMTELYRVSDLSSAQYNTLFDNMTESAKEYGVALSDVISSTADWVKQGFDANVANGLAEVSVQYQHIGDISQEEANDNLITAYNGFKDQLLNMFSGDEVAAVGYAADIFNELGNNYAIEAGQVGDALTRCASALDLAGNTIQESAGMVTGITEVTQDPEKAGSALKILSLRLRGMKGSLEEMGEEVDDNVENLSKMQGQVLNMTHGEVNIFDDNGEFRSTYDIMNDIAEVYDELSSIDQANLLETIAGKNRANDVAALIENWERVEDATESANNAEGSAAREHEKYMKSLQGHLDVLKAQFQSFSNTLMGTGFLNAIIDGLGTVLETVEKVIKVFDGIPGVNGVLTTMVGIIALINAAYRAFNGQMLTSISQIKVFGLSLSALKAGLSGFGISLRNIGAAAMAVGTNFGVMISSLRSGGVTFSAIGASVRTLMAALLSGQISISAFGASLKAMFVSIKAGPAAFKTFTATLKSWLVSLKSGKISLATFQANLKAFATSMKATTISIQGGAVGIKGFIASLKALTTALNVTKVASIATTVALEALQIVASMGVMMVITALITAFDQFIHAAENAAEAADDFATETRETANSSKEEVNSLNELIAKYQELASQDTRDIGVRAEIKDVQSQIVALVGEEAGALDLVNGSLDTQLAKLQEIQRTKAEEALDDSSSAYYAAKDAGDKAVSDNISLGKEFAFDGEAAYDEMQALIDAGYAVNNAFNEGVFGDKGKATIQLETDQFGNELETAADKVEYLDGMINTLEASGVETASSDLYQGLQSSREHFQKYVDEMETAAQDMLAAAFNVAQSDEQIAEMYVHSADSLAEMRSAMIEKIKSAPELAQALAEGSITQGDISQQVDSFLSTSEEYSKYFDEWYNDIENAFDVQDRLGINIEDLLGKDAGSALSGEIDSYISDINRLDEALSSFNDGDLSDSDINKLIKDFPELGNIMDELGIDTENFNMAIIEMINRLNDGSIQDAFGNIDITSMTDEQIAQLEQLEFAVLDLGNVASSTSINISIESETTSLEALNTALAESVTAAGLSAESLEALQSRWAGLENEGWDLSAAFEETANGIHLNSQRVAELEQAYAQQNLDQVNDSLSEMEAQYNILTAQINNCSDAAERSSLYAQRDALVDQINAAGELAAQYEGLTSKYNQWQAAQEAGEERDMYEGVAEGLKTMGEDLEDGWLDTADRQLLSLLTGQDLLTASTKKCVDAYNNLDKTINSAGHSINDFFKYDADGNITSEGVGNWWEAVDAAEKEIGKNIVKKDKDGNIISFDVDVDDQKAIADALGVSEELVDIFIRASADAGFVVNMDGTYSAMADLKTSAEQAYDVIKKMKDDLGGEVFEFNFAASSDEELATNLEEAKSLLGNEKFYVDGKFNMNAEGAEEAFEIASYFQSLQDQMTYSGYLTMDTSSAKENLKEPLEQVQQFSELAMQKHQIELTGGDTSEIDAQLSDIANSLYSIDNTEVKAQLGIEGMTQEEILSALETGEVEVPGTISFEANMSASLEKIADYVSVMTGELSEQEFNVKWPVNVEAEADKVYTKDVEDKTDSAIKNISNDGKKTETKADIEMKADKVDTTEPEAKIDNAIKMQEELESIQKEVDVETEVNEIDAADVDAKIKEALEVANDEIDKKIELATDVEGDVDALLKFVEGAQKLNKLDKDISVNVEATVIGNVTDEFEYKLDNLETFADSAKGLDKIGSPVANVTANVYGNVLGKFEESIDNLEVFAEGAKELKDIGVIQADVTANMSGNVGGIFDEGIDRLPEFAEGAHAINGLPEDIEVNVIANMDGTIGGIFDNGMDRLPEFAAGAKAIANLPEDIKVNVIANMDGTIGGIFDNGMSRLPEFADGANAIKDLPDDIEVNVIANMDGTIGGIFDNGMSRLSEFAAGAEAIKDLPEDIKVNVIANMDGTIGGVFDNGLDRLPEFAAGAKAIEELPEDIKVNVIANMDGTIGGIFDNGMHRLLDFADGANAIKDLPEDIRVNVIANMDGTIGGIFDNGMDRLPEFAAGAKAISSLPDDIMVNVVANMDGTIGGIFDNGASRLTEFADGANAIKDLPKNTEVNVIANMDGTIGGIFDNGASRLSEFADGAEAISSLPKDIRVDVIANMDGTIGGIFDNGADRLPEFAASAEALKGIGNVTTNVIANMDGTIGGIFDNGASRLPEFAAGAKTLMGLPENIKVNVEANMDGTIGGVFDNGASRLSEFAAGAKAINSLPEDIKVNVVANGSLSFDGTLSDLSLFADNASALQDIESKTITIDASAKVTGEDKVKTLSDSIKKLVNKTINVVANVTGKDAVVAMKNAIVKIVSKTVNIAANVSGTKLVSALRGAISKLKGKTVKVKETGAAAAKERVDALKSSISGLKDKSIKLTVNGASDAVTKINNVVTALSKIKNKDVRISVRTSTSNANSGDGEGPAAGTAHIGGSAFAGGTSGRAFAQGDWGIKGNGVALGGELGQEIVVRDGRFFTIGDNGAEFFRYKHNDIVFNATQTAALFKYGGIKGANPRGKMLATGSAFAGGSLPSSGRAFAGSGTGGLINVPGHKYTTTTTTTTTTTSSGGGGSRGTSGGTGGAGSKAKDTKKAKEVFDWIEVKIKRLEQALDSLGRTADSVYRTWDARNRALGSSITKTSDMIKLQETAAARYLAQANKDAGNLSAYWKKRVQNGAIDISAIKDEKLAEKIKAYQQWYEKYKDCKIAADEYRESLKELYSQRFDNALDKFDAKLTEIENNSSILEERISQSEEKGQIVNTKYYEALKRQKQAEINTIKNERAQLVALRDEAVASGAVTKYSQEWYRMNEEIDACTQSIEEGETALLEYNNAIRDIEWETFDLQLERIQQMNDEAEFLIDLMSNKKLYNENGQITDEGMATMGLHAQNYNVHMEKALKYDKEIAELNAEIAKDPKNQDLINRRDELIEAQRESILAAEDEKEAIRDLVEEGINLELDALQERIDKYKEALESEKDLYDYQKKVKEQTKEIASIEKQMAAYAGDDSEEAKAKIQELKVSLEEAKADLEETEYDKYISDQGELLDDLYEEYEELLNSRLDNIDVLLEEQIAAVNDSSAKIGKTIEALASAVGYDISNETNSIWNNDTKKDSVTTYTDGDADTKTDTQTSVNSADDDVQVGDVDTTIPDATNPNQGNTKIDLYDKVTLKSGTNYFSTASGKKSDGKSSKVGTTKKKNSLYITDIQSGKAYPYRLSWTADGATGHLGYVRLNGTKGRKNFTGYATGKEKLMKDETAWTQEKGTEFIVRPSDGAILTPLAQGDSVLNAEASGNIWNMANSPADFIRENLRLDDVNAPINGNTQSTIVNNLDGITISLPGVKNYDEFVQAMSKDKNVERFVKSITTDLIAGKSKLAKGKSIR